MARKAAAHIFLFGLAILAGVLLSRKPWVVLEGQQRQTQRQLKEMRESEARREELVRLEAKYQNSLGREELARRRGLLKRGERPIEIP
jgi:hypothetical protein